MRVAVIEKARFGGYVVKDVRGPQDIWEVFFAGSLLDCLDFIQQRFTETDGK
jgi:hypothetical protein